MSEDPALGRSMDGMVKRVAIAVLLLAVVGVAACGDDEPAQPADDVQGSKTSQDDSQVRSEPWVGYWESTARSKGGIGSAMYIRPSGDALLWMCVLVDGKYSVDGNQLMLGDNSEGVRFRIDGNSMTQAGDGGQELVMTRIGAGTGIVGDWRFQHYVGQEAFQRFGEDGSLFFRLIMGTIVVRRYERIREGVALKAGARLERTTLHLRDGQLVADDGKSYVRVGAEPWYPLP